MLKRLEPESMPATPPTESATDASPVVGAIGFAVLSITSNLLLLAGPLFMLQVYDRVLPSRSVPTLVALSALVLALYGLFALVEWLRARLANRVGALVEESLSPRLLGAIARNPGRNQVDPMRDLDAVRGFLSGPGPIALFDLPWLPLYLGLIYLLHPLLGMVTAVGALLIVLLLLSNELLSRRPARGASVAQARRQSLAEDVRAGAEVIRAMAMEPQLHGRWHRACDDVANAATASSDRTAFYSALTRSFRYLLQSAVLATGAWLVLAGESSAGLIIGASIISSRAVAPVEQAVAQWRGFVAARQAWGRLKTQLNGKATARGVRLPPPFQRLTVQSLASAAPSSDKPLIENIGFTLQAGEGLGVVGLSGSGKSSLARALVGVWPHLGGDVRLDGQMLEHYDPETIGRCVGYMPQEVGLFSGTVGENISRFRTGATAQEIIAAARAAGIHELIATLPDGYETQIGERGAILSAGQRQRIGLARALYGDPFLLVLDEPNSNLDAEGDAALTAALLGARAGGAIVVVVAHRPSAIAAVDKLLFLKAGRQLAFGPKADVLKAVTGRQEVADA